MPYTLTTIIPVGCAETAMNIVDLAVFSGCVGV